MRAAVITEFGGPEVLAIEQCPDPASQPGYIQIDVKAFGVNRAELYFRAGLWGDVARISGIECVGVVYSDPQGSLQRGQKVLALMGGMGRDIDGSYAEKVSVPFSNVVAIDSTLSWEDLAAIPESYATAWACLHRNLDIQPGQRLLVRGATSALGQAVVNIAATMGADVIGTTRSKTKFDMLETLGAQPMLERPDLSIPILETHNSGIDAVLDIVGNSTIVDSLAMIRCGGRACLAGFLGGGDPIADFNPLSQMPSGVLFSFFGSAFVFGTPDYPLSEIPFQEIIGHVEQGRYRAKPARVFGLDEIAKAHRLMASNELAGKSVVKLSS